MLIFNFFDRETTTKISILSFLFNQEFECSTEQLVKNLNLDRRTVSKYLKQLQLDSYSYLENGKQVIELNRGKGNRFTGTKIDYQKLTYKLVTESIAFSFISDLFFLPNINILDFCEKHFISDTVFNKLQQKIKHFFKPYNIEIKSYKGTIYVSENELSFRYFGYVFFWGLFKGITWPFETIISESKVENFLNSQFSNFSILKSISYSQWAYMLAINICRIKNGYTLSKNDLPYYASDLNNALFFTSSDSINSENLMKEFFKLYPTTQVEFDYFTLLTQIGVRVYLINDVLEEALFFHKTNNTPIYEMYEMSINAFHDELQSLDNETNRLCTALIFSTFMTVTLFPHYETTISGYSYDDYLIKTFPFLKMEMENRVEKMKNESTSALLIDQPLITFRFCELYSLVAHPSDFNPKIIIKIETDLPIIMEKLLANQLLSILSPFFNISFISPIHKKGEPSPDLIIASSRIKLMENDNIAVTYFSPAFSSKDMKIIMDKINEINILKTRSL